MRPEGTTYLEIPQCAFEAKNKQERNKKSNLSHISALFLRMQPLSLWAASDDS